MSDKPFRVLLDLTELQLRDLKYVWINVSPRELKTIADFKQLLLHKINIEKTDVKLFVRDGRLLDEETVSVLREDDTVKVEYGRQHPCLHSCVEISCQKSVKVSRKRNFNEIETLCDVNESQMESVAFPCSAKESDTEQAKTVKKKKKHKPSQTASSDNEGNHFLTANENNHFVTANESSISVAEPGTSHRDKNIQKKSNRKKSCVTLDQSIINVDLSKTFDSFSTDIATPTSQNINVSTVLKPDNSVDLANNSLSKSNDLSFEDEKMERLSTESSRADSKELSNTSPGKKHRRRRKRNRKNSQIVETAVKPTDADNTSFKAFPSVISDQFVKRKHIHYSLSPVKTDSCVDDGNQYHELPSGTIVKESKSTKAQQFNDYPKISTPAQSVGCGSPNWHVSEMSTRNTLSYNVLGGTNNSPARDDESPAKTSEISWINISEAVKNSMKLYEDLPELNSLPEVGTHVAYKEGVIKSINPDTEEIEIELLKGLVIPGRIGKFENLKEDEIPSPIMKTCDVLKWCDLLTPKLLPQV